MSSLPVEALPRGTALASHGCSGPGSGCWRSCPDTGSPPSARGAAPGEWRKRDGRRVLFCGEEPWLSYTEQAARLVAKIWPQRNLPYSVLSAVAHGDLLGLQRNLVQSPPGTPG